MLHLKIRRASIWLPLLASLCFETGRGFETGLSFVGSLERVGEQSISVQLPDRRVIDAMLPSAENLGATAIAAQYGFGDEVEITCKPIQPVWEESTSRYQSLEVTAMRLVRRTSPEEASKLLEARAREGKNLLKRPKGNAFLTNKSTDLNAPGSKELEDARRVNLAYAANMPNFVADETATRYRSSSKRGPWRLYDKVDTEITFRGRRLVRQQIRRNGQPWGEPFEALPGYKWYEGFETEISPLFDPQCPTVIEYQGRSKVGGRQVLEYRFSSPVNGCFPFLYFEYQRYNPARTGHVFIDDPGGSVIQLDDKSDGFPAGFEFAEREEHITWDYVKIGEESHLLPVRASFLVRYSAGARYKVEVEYKNHRHFEASSNVTF